MFFEALYSSLGAVLEEAFGRLGKNAEVEQEVCVCVCTWGGGARGCACTCVCVRMPMRTCTVCLVCLPCHAVSGHAATLHNAATLLCT